MRPAATPASAKDEPHADSHVRFVYASLFIGVVGGFSLAVWLPIAGALGRINLSWVTHAQLHGHMQVAGFAGLFVLGVLTKLAPRFGNGNEVNKGLLDVAFVCLTVGLALRVGGQPLAGHAPFAVALAIGPALEFVGTAAAATAIGAVLWPAAASGAPHAMLIVGGLGWWTLQAALSAGWYIDLARDGGTVLRSDRDSVVLVMQVYGGLLGVFAGVGLRTFPTFFAMPAPSIRLGRGAAVLLWAGVIAWSATGFASTRGHDFDAVMALGQAGVGTGILVLVSATGWWRKEMRLAAASQPLAWPLRMTLIALTSTGVLLLATGLAALLRGTPTSAHTLDAARHVFTVGVVTQGIVTMAQLILPEFASERLVHRPSPWRGILLGVGLASAAVLRGVVPLLGLTGTVGLWLMAVGGGLAFTSMATFAIAFWRARRMHVAYLAKVAKWRLQPIEVRGTPPGAE
ncbi:MAG: hypothetical protein EPO65_03400 [Dehalococcoidia bacterium]|nr:MAG: hypothetical protein EPO65_03400 [Dehalococcoidia bacterium]